METSKTSSSFPLPGETGLYPQHGVYQAGPFQGRPIAHPYNTVLLRLSRMGVSAPERQFDETDKEYVVRLDRTYTGLFQDVISSGILGAAVR